MLKNYIVSAWRNMMRSKLYTFINIICLTVGISGAVIMAMYLNHEFSYDSHHLNHERIYRLEGNYMIGGNASHLAITPFPLGPALKLEFSEIETYARLFTLEDVLVKIDDKEFLEQEFVFTDSTLFDVFTHTFIYGQAQGALSEPNTVVLNRILSEKYFGDVDPTGRNITANDQTYQVVGVIEELPGNTHMKYQGMLAIHSADNAFAYSLNPQLFWNINMNFTYVQVHQGASISSVLNNMEAFNEKYIAPLGSMIGGSAEFIATPLRQTHFTKVQLAAETGSKTSLLIFSVVAIFLVIIAAVNYTNLATARAAKRAREIALRKVSGATRNQMVMQFMTESLLLAGISLLFSLLVVELFLPGFNALADQSFTLASLLNGRIIFQVIAITLFTGFLSGIYPAFFLSGMEPSNILKSGATSRGGSGSLRKALVVFQFFISVTLIAGTITVQRQLHYLQNKDMGFETANRMVVSFQGRAARERIEAIEQTVRQNPHVLKTTKCFSIPGLGSNLHAVRVQSGDDMVEATISSNIIDPDFLDVLGIKLILGRGFDSELRGDVNTAIIVNEAAVKQFGWHDDPLGKIIQWRFNEAGEPELSLRVVGVVQDYNYLTLENPINPLMMLLPENIYTFGSIIVEHLPGYESELKVFLEEEARNYEPSRLPNVFALDKGFKTQFSSEKKLGSIFGIFALVCIMMSFLGLFGLSSFATEQRKKEIGIRKVLGSSGLSILAMFYQEFSLLVLAATVFAGPVTWLLMERWLQGFTYQINMNIQPILASGLLSLVVAIITVSYHTIMASRMNPADVMRAD